MQNKLVFFTYPSCTSCRKTKAWLSEKGVSYEERHLFKNPPTVDELLEIVKKTNNGLEEILSTRSQMFKNLDVDIEELKLSQLLDLLSKEPRLLKRPILTDGENIVIGYDKPALEQHFAS
ncbi:Spx/MgsR family RNA polymerase-binding regulatory protein [Tepidibacillus infernus]|uniref:Transcriptional regulator n=1 Tax=Tepidibacillus decaturensis TaxID=1413211 RepID=A0A135L459_9BACI|nr:MULTISPECIES: Spx/MgsR family RNA polymerase-binding regulatory protein [Tepidibacillus]KXG43788.1 transcriptional regulator [Tepidibacillus decaturensis]GBF12612.1 regulatory protein MgsR [Tepidibacillus sp. HK-1]